ncbi:hypothetical protein [Arthrobacter flavus]|uniref:Uncharacterized protein n=1 Tax=Arthrobacter flavus TaxID=95172 RepID=A0ABW4QB99_9MICC
MIGSVPVLAGVGPGRSSSAQVFSDQAEPGPSRTPLTRRRRWAIAAGVTAAVAALAAAVIISGNFGPTAPLATDQPNSVGTGSAAASSEPAPTTPAAAGSPLATYTPTGVGGDAALLTGSLILEDGCVYIEASDSTRVLAYFPDTDASWSDGVLTFFGTDYQLGQTISLGGGASTVADTEENSASFFTPESCRPDSRWIVSQVPPSPLDITTTEPVREPSSAADMGLTVEVPAGWDLVAGAQGLDVLNPAGEVVSNLQRSAEGGIGGACAEPAVPWQEVRALPVSVDTPNGPVNAKFVLRVFTGDRIVGTTALVLADDPTAGEGCMLYNVISSAEVGLLSLTNNFQLSPYGEGRQFESLSDAEAYAGSAEFDALAAIAESIVITD